VYDVRSVSKVSYGYFHEGSPYSKGHTPLQVAIEFGSVEAVSVLLDRGADVNNKAFGCLPLLYVYRLYGECEYTKELELKYRDIIQILLRAGADPNACDEEGGVLSTVLFLWCWGWEEKISFLMQHGCKISSPLRSDMTILALLCQDSLDYYLVKKLTILRRKGASIHELAGVKCGQRLYKDKICICICICGLAVSIALFPPEDEVMLQSADYAWSQNLRKFQVEHQTTVGDYSIKFCCNKNLYAIALKILKNRVLHLKSQLQTGKELLKRLGAENERLQAREDLHRLLEAEKRNLQVLNKNIRTGDEIRQVKKELRHKEKELVKDLKMEIETISRLKEKLRVLKEKTRGVKVILEDEIANLDDELNEVEQAGEKREARMEKLQLISKGLQKEKKLRRSLQTETKNLQEIEGKLQAEEKKLQVEEEKL